MEQALIEAEVGLDKDVWITRAELEAKEAMPHRKAAALAQDTQASEAPHAVRRAEEAEPRQSRVT